MFKSVYKNVALIVSLTSVSFSADKDYTAIIKQKNMDSIVVGGIAPGGEKDKDIWMESPETAFVINITGKENPHMRRDAFIPTSDLNVRDDRFFNDKEIEFLKNSEQIKTVHYEHIGLIDDLYSSDMPKKLIDLLSANGNFIFSSFWVHLISQSTSDYSTASLCDMTGAGQEDNKYVPEKPQEVIDLEKEYYDIANPIARRNLEERYQTITDEEKERLMDLNQKIKKINEARVKTFIPGLDTLINKEMQIENMLEIDPFGTHKLYFQSLDKMNKLKESFENMGLVNLKFFVERNQSGTNVAYSFKMTGLKK